MKNSISIILCFLLVTFIPWQTGKTRNNISPECKFSKDHIIVKLKQSNNLAAASVNYEFGIIENKLTGISKSLGLEAKSVKKLFPKSIKSKISLYNKYELGSYFLVYFSDEVNPIEISSKFEKDEHVEFAEPDFIGEAAGKRGFDSTPNDRFFKRQWALYNDGSIRTSMGKQGKFGADMNVVKGWDVAKGSSDVIVAILDSGVKLDHPDLDGKIWVNTEETINGRDDDENGFIDDINGYNFAYDNPDVRDDGGHGTNIAGTIGACTNNEIGIAGIDQKCKIMSCKNLDNENLGEYSWWSASLYYAANNGANIINMSEGGYDYSRTLENSVKYAYESGCLIVASMMNKNNGDNYYPACFPEVMAVGATDTDDGRCREFTWGGGSNWGRHISVVAPGNRIYGLDYKDNNNYDVYWSGTSQATAYVSGIASVILGQDLSRKNDDLRDIISRTAVDRVGDPREDTEGWDEYYGYGRVDLFAALTYGNFPSGNKDEKKTGKTNIEDKVPKNDDDKRAKPFEPNNNQDQRDEKRAKPDYNDR